METETKGTAPEWITLAEAAKLTGKSVRTLRRYIKGGKLRATEEHSGKGTIRYLVHRDEVEAVAKPQNVLARQKGSIDTLVKHGHELSQLSALVREAQKSRRRIFISELIIAGCIVALVLLGLLWQRGQIEALRGGWTKDRTEMSRHVQSLKQAQSAEIRALREQVERLKEAREEKATPEKVRRRFLGIF